MSLLAVTIFRGLVPSLIFLLTFFSRNLNLFLRNNTLYRQLSECKQSSKIFKMSSFKSAIGICCSTFMVSWLISTCSALLTGFQLFRESESFLYPPSSNCRKTVLSHLCEQWSSLTLFPFPLFFFSPL